MNKVIVKMAFFILVLVALGATNTYIINGPMLQHNTDLSMQQFKGVINAPAGDFQVAGYSVAFSTVYVVEAVFLALLGVALFLPHILNLLFGSEGTPSQGGVFKK